MDTPVNSILSTHCPAHSQVLGSSAPGPLTMLSFLANSQLRPQATFSSVLRAENTREKNHLTTRTGFTSALFPSIGAHYCSSRVLSMASGFHFSQRPLQIFSSQDSRFGRPCPISKYLPALLRTSISERIPSTFLS